MEDLVLHVLAQPRFSTFVQFAKPGSAAPKYLDAIRDGDPAVAQELYRLYAGQIRSYLRRHTGVQEVESTVFSVLVEAVRSIREHESPTMEDLSQTVRDLSQQGVFALRRSRNRKSPSGEPSMTLDAHRDLINSLFSVLDCREREILLRSYLLAERDDEISHELDVPVLQIRRTRAKARVLFRISSESGRQNAAAAQA
jgi:DNA-directed RNA polymerase specialized sigma24 family protein